jgi:hypothetical protein
MRNYPSFSKKKSGVWKNSAAFWIFETGGCH